MVLEKHKLPLTEERRIVVADGSYVLEICKIGSLLENRDISNTLSNYAT